MVLPEGHSNTAINVVCGPHQTDVNIEIIKAFKRV